MRTVAPIEKASYAGIQGDVDEERAVRGQGQRHQRPHAQPRETGARAPRDQPEQGTLGQELPDDAQTAGPHGEAHGDLAAPFGGPRRQEAGHVGAGEQQHQAHGGGQCGREAHEGATHQRMHAAFERGQRAEADTAATRARVFAFEPPSDDVHCGLGLSHRDPGLKPRHHEVSALSAVLDPHRHEQLGLQTHVDPWKSRGATPTTVKGRPPRVTIVPTTLGSPAEPPPPESPRSGPRPGGGRAPRFPRAGRSGRGRAGVRATRSSCRSRCSPIRRVLTPPAPKCMGVGSSASTPEKTPVKRVTSRQSAGPSVKYRGPCR